MIEELLWVVRLVRMIFSAGGYSKRVQITSDLHPLFFSGERGIRTPGTSQFNGFQDRRNRPLCHLSMVNFTPFEAHPQGRVEALTDAKIAYFGEFARADLSERAMSPS